MTDTEIENLRRICDEATAGPWHQDEWSPTHVRRTNGNGQTICSTKLRTEDAAFIAVARSAVPLILDEIAKLRAENVETWAERDRIKDDSDRVIATGLDLLKENDRLKDEILVLRTHVITSAVMKERNS